MELPEDMLYQGVSVDIAFGEPRPHFGDLFRICGGNHPRFPPTGQFGFERLTDLQFEQVDDYFGVRSVTGEGSDVPIWLYPLVGGQPVHHHRGPFDGVRLEYNILRNPVRRAEHFLRCVEEFAALGAGANTSAEVPRWGSGPTWPKCGPILQRSFGTGRRRVSSLARTLRWP